MEKRTFDLNLKEKNRIFLFDGDILYAVNDTKSSISPFVYRWPATESFWAIVHTALAELLEANPVRFIELMKFSEDEELKENCKVVYEKSRESISKKYNEIIKITTVKLETLKKITF